MYYVRIPLRYLLPPDQLVGGAAEFKKRVFLIRRDLEAGCLPSWATDFRDLENHITIEEGAELPAPAEPQEQK